MSVRKDQRSQSSMEFIKNANRLRKAVTDWLFRDFGRRKSKVRSHTIQDITLEDQEIINDIINRYENQSKYILKTDYPDWFIDFERKTIISILRDLTSNITHANSIYAINLDELNERRIYQDKAIGDCFDLKTEIENIAEQISLNLDKLSPILEMLQKEITLLKGWRQSDNKIRKKFEKTELENNENMLIKTTSKIKETILNIFYLIIEEINEKRNNDIFIISETKEK
ncbi:MAG TPA: hypothetical protein DCW90_04350 [Lachnospiraceae bacterium]|nr:hypothetical protein [Lachnospiraceae bacterium]